jgi:phosphoglycolate phosphatase
MAPLLQLQILPRRPARLRPMPRAFLMDLDGTLVDTMGTFADLAAEIIARRYSLTPRNARQLYLRTSGVPFAQQLDVIFGECGENAAASEEFESRKHQIAMAARMDGETARALESLKLDGFRLVVSSNGMQRHVERFAARSPGLFDLALGYGEGLGKGEPHVAAVCAEFGLARREITFVGDSLRDGELAAETGVGFVGRAGTFSRATFERRFPAAPVVDTVADLPALL